MKICGLKLTHDSGLALLDGDELAFSIEMEKVDNGSRYRKFENLAGVPDLLGRFGYGLSQVDLFVIDGWDGLSHSKISVRDGKKPLTLQAAPYIQGGDGQLFTPVSGVGLEIGGSSFAFESYPHLAGHLASAWLTSPFVTSNKTTDCLIWDASIFPRLYRIDRHSKTVTWRGNLFNLIGHVYGMAGEHFGPFRQDRTYNSIYNLGTAGKLMAYIALGRVSMRAVDIFLNLYKSFFESEDSSCRAYCDSVANGDARSAPAMAYVHRYLSACGVALEGLPDEDILASFHVFVERMLIGGLRKAREEAHLAPSPNLCLAGGCALNIKWNSAIRAKALYRDVWAPPFPNDSGSAIGAACSALMARQSFSEVKWDVYRGPYLEFTQPMPPGWKAEPCGMGDLAGLISRGEPVVFLAGRAELGPRALGARSIIADARSGAMKDSLNEIKQREPFRPVAPICLEDRAPVIFDPGTPDPFMLFEHAVRADWRDRIPAVVHLDGSARLQTVPRDADIPIAHLLRAYEDLTGIPLLCNTSANFAGKGFFPDAASACRWGMIAYVWADGLLYTKAG